MNSSASPTFWWQFIGLLAVEATLIVALITFLQRWTQSAFWRRTLWQVCTLSLLGLVIFEGTGMGRETGRWFVSQIKPGWRAIPQDKAKLLLPAIDPPQRPPQVVPSVIPESNLTADNTGVQTKVAPSFISETSLPAPRPSQPLESNTPSDSLDRAQNVVPTVSAHHRIAAWTGLAWLIGTFILLFRVGLARLLLWVFCRNRPTVEDSHILARLRDLAQRLGLRRSVRLIESRHLASPITFGLLRPVIALPAHFQQTFSIAQQDAILAHELAHLASRDPAWHLLADLTSAFVWWHPLVWWSRRQWHAASESAADEASLLIADGPATLAECLVKLGGQTRSLHSPAWLSIEGSHFQSGLGRRVERLVNLGERIWNPPQSGPSILVKITGPLILVVIVILSSAWATPQALTQGETMKTMRQTWKQSFATFALGAMFSHTATNTSAEATTLHNKNAPPGGMAATVTIPSQQQQEPTDSRVNIEEMSDNSGKAPESSRYRMPPELMRRYGLVPGNAHQIATNAPDRGLSREVMTRYGLLPPAEDGSANQSLTNSRYRGMSAEMMRRYGLLSRTEVEPPASNAKSQAGPSPAHRALIEKMLDQITFPELKFADNLPLNEVVKSIAEETRQRDPQKRTLNFIISGPAETSTTATLDPNTGLPIATESLNPSQITLKLRFPLRHIRLRDVLNVLTKVASAPLRYSVEDYGIVFSPGTTADAEESPMDPSVASPGYRGMSQEMMKRYGLMMRGGPAPTERAEGEPVALSPTKRVIQDKLNRIVLEEIKLPLNFPLSEVVRMLDEQARQRDPSQQGINFVLAEPTTVISTVDPVTGLGITRNASTDLGDVTLHLNLPLRNVRLVDALEVMTKVASQPIRYSVEDYGVLISLDSTRPLASARPAPTNPSTTPEPPLQARAFKLDPRPVEQGMERAFGIHLEKEQGQANGEDKRINIKNALLQLAQHLGIALRHPDQQVFYNDFTQTLMIRAPSADLATLQAAIETLGGAVVGQAVKEELKR